MVSGSGPKPPGRSNSQQTRDHTPARPSSLRQSFTRARSPTDEGGGENHDPSPPTSPRTVPHIHVNDESVDDLSLAGPSIPQQPPYPTETTALLQGGLDLPENAHEGPCNHGTFSPRPGSPSSSMRGYEGPEQPTPGPESALPIMDGFFTTISRDGDWRRRWASKMKSKKMSTSSALAERHGVKHTSMM